MTLKRVTIPTLLVIVAMWLLPPFVANASPAVVSCGALLTRSTTLGHDLVNCPGSGLVIGAANIVVNLNGHTLSGSGGGDGAGVDNSGGFKNVTITGGTVMFFHDGVLLDGTRGNVVSKIHAVHETHAGIGVTNSTGTRVESNVTAFGQTGIFVDTSSGVSVRDNSISDVDQSGLPLFASTGVTVTSNTVTRCGGPAIGVFNESDRNVVDSNKVSNSGEGIALSDGADHNIVRSNDSSGSFDGVLLDIGTHDNQVLLNSLHNNLITGVDVVGSFANVIVGNSVARNGDGSEAGIHLVDIGDPTVASDHNLVSGNLLTANIGDGILVDAHQTHTTIVANVADHNTVDGIGAFDPTTTVTRNVVTHNGELGIDAVVGVKDGHGNLASGNADARQCVGVACRTI